MLPLSWRIVLASGKRTTGCESVRVTITSLTLLILILLILALIAPMTTLRPATGRSVTPLTLAPLLMLVLCC